MFDPSDALRLYKPGISGPVGSWVVPKSEVIGKSPEQLQKALALDYTPTHYVDVDATGVFARVGTSKPNFGQPGLGVQVELLERTATFDTANAQTIPTGAIR